ncbi:MAG: hypothetical protein HEQ37_06270 [Acidovorax sp.]|nr:hypothetical protein [Acidovorax sp.]
MGSLFFLENAGVDFAGRAGGSRRFGYRASASRTWAFEAAHQMQDPQFLNTCPGETAGQSCRMPAIDITSHNLSTVMPGS